VLVPTVPGTGRYPGSRWPAALAQGIHLWLTSDRQALLFSGGATARAALAHTGISALQLAGECLPGLPLANMEEISIIVISGGFGEADTRVTQPEIFQGRNRMAEPGKRARRSLSEIVFERMERAIKSGSYHPDERLPTEHDLAAEFEVSRPVVRDALRKLRERGLIYSRQGTGSFVRTIGLKQPLGFGPLENVSDLLSCYEFRLTLEPAAAACAAERRDLAALERIDVALGLMRDVTNRQHHREDADFQFHLAIAIASENTCFSIAMEALRDHIAVGMRFHGASVVREVRGLAQVFEEHAAISDAIRTGNSVLAHDLMQTHLEHSRDGLLTKRRPVIVAGNGDLPVSLHEQGPDLQQAAAGQAPICGVSTRRISCPSRPGG